MLSRRGHQIWPDWLFTRFDHTHARTHSHTHKLRDSWGQYNRVTADNPQLLIRQKFMNLWLDTDLLMKEWTMSHFRFVAGVSVSLSIHYITLLYSSSGFLCHTGRLHPSSGPCKRWRLKHSVSCWSYQKHFILLKSLQHFEQSVLRNNIRKHSTPNSTPWLVFTGFLQMVCVCLSPHLWVLSLLLFFYVPLMNSIPQWATAKSNSLTPFLNTIILPPSRSLLSPVIGWEGILASLFIALRV